MRPIPDGRHQPTLSPFSRSLARGLVVLVSTILVGACRPPATPAPPATPSTPSEIVRAFYASYHGDFRQAATAVFSQGLREAVASAVSIEQKSRDAVKASAFPSDKPQIIEGEVFSGLYEGFTGHQIGAEKVNGSSATVDVQFTNSNYSVGWIDGVQLVDESGWKIDDVRYLDKKAGALGVRDVFRDFEQVAARDPLLNPRSQ